MICRFAVNSEMRLLDLFCGAGGAAMGYHRAGFEIVGVDIAPQPHYPFVFVQADALEFAEAHGHEFDVIHASPPCQRYSVCTPKWARKNHPDLIAAIRHVLQATGRPYVIENVAGARHLLRNPIMLCGTMFGLPLWRHRWFEIWPEMMILTPPCAHDCSPILVSGTTRRKSRGRIEYTIAEKQAAMGISWMTTAELDKAIPPAYTEYIGGWLIRKLALYNTA